MPDLLTSGCAVLAIVACTWLALVFSLALLQAVGARGPLPTHAPVGTTVGPRLIRTLAFALVGGALLAAPAQAAPPSGSEARAPSPVGGLRLPDRVEDDTKVRPAVGDPARATPAARSSMPQERTRTVRPGDCLWSIAARSQPPQASPAVIDHTWRAIYTLNRARIGPDPDVLHPGLRLRLPASVISAPANSGSADDTFRPAPTTGDRP